MRAPTRWLTRIGLPFLSTRNVVRAATTPPAWSPGVARGGTDRRNDTIVFDRGRTVTVFVSSLTQEPTSTDLAVLVSTSNPPSEVLNASPAYRLRVSFW